MKKTLKESFSVFFLGSFFCLSQLLFFTVGAHSPYVFHGTELIVCQPPFAEEDLNGIEDDAIESSLPKVQRRRIFK